MLLVSHDRDTCPKLVGVFWMDGVRIGILFRLRLLEEQVGGEGRTGESVGLQLITVDQR